LFGGVILAGTAGCGYSVPLVCPGWGILLRATVRRQTLLWREPDDELLA
jgi:hypothetical protein